MKGRWGAAGVLALLLLVASAPRAQESEPGTAAAEPITWFAQALAHSEAGLNVTHFWSKGAKLRAETVVAGRKVVTIVSGDTYYAYDGLGQQGVAIRRAPAAMAGDVPGRRPFGQELDALIRQGAEKIRDDTILGRPIEVFRVTDRLGRREVWVTRDPMRLPLRVTIYKRNTSNTIKTDYLNWLTGLPIADAFFEPAPGIELARLEYQDYLKRQAEGQSLGPVPVLYSDLLHGRR